MESDKAIADKGSVRVVITFIIFMIGSTIAYRIGYASFILAAMAAYFKAAMDTLEFHYDDSSFALSNKPSYFNPAISWKNKYRIDGKTPKFFLSTTLFVFLTDAWHLFQAGFLLTISLSVVFYQPLVNCWFDLILWHTILGIVFYLYYNVLFYLK